MEEKIEKFFKKSWISAAVLKHPSIGNNRVQKGALILNQVDPVIELYPHLKELFFIIERHGWFGPNEATMADIMLVEDLTTWETVKKQSPDAILLDIGPADFIDHSAFYPMNIDIQFDVIQIACWSRRKRIELFIEAAARLPNLNFVHLGHFENNGNTEELKYRDECIAKAESIAKNISFPYAECNRNDDFPNTKNEMNIWINRSRLGVLTAMSEGINRFKMECFAADKPCLIANDVAFTTRKHINEMTGVLFHPTPSELAVCIENSLLNLDEFSPRDYIFSTTGKTNSLSKLKLALKTLCFHQNQEYNFDDIDWDGRNESLLWGEDAITLITGLIEQYNPHYQHLAEQALL